MPLDGAEFELGPGRGVPVPPEAAKVFLQLAGALRKQHQVRGRPQKMTKIRGGQAQKTG